MRSRRRSGDPYGNDPAGLGSSASRATASSISRTPAGSSWRNPAAWSIAWASQMTSRLTRLGRAAAAPRHAERTRSAWRPPGHASPPALPGLRRPLAPARWRPVPGPASAGSRTPAPPPRLGRRGGSPRTTRCPGRSPGSRRLAGRLSCCFLYGTSGFATHPGMPAGLRGVMALRPRRVLPDSAELPSAPRRA